MTETAAGGRRVFIEKYQFEDQKNKKLALTRRNFILFTWKCKKFPSALWCSYPKRRILKEPQHCMGHGARISSGVSEMMSLIDPRDLGVILRHGRKFLRVRGEERSHWPACVFSSRNDPVEEKKSSVPRCSTARGYCIRLKIRTKCESTYCSVKLNYDTSQKVRYTNQRCEEHTG